MRGRSFPYRIDVLVGHPAGTPRRGITMKKGECLKQTCVVNLIAWNGNIGSSDNLVSFVCEGND